MLVDVVFFPLHETRTMSGLASGEEEIKLWASRWYNFDNNWLHILFIDIIIVGFG